MEIDKDVSGRRRRTVAAAAAVVAGCLAAPAFGADRAMIVGLPTVYAPGDRVRVEVIFEEDVYVGSAPPVFELGVGDRMHRDMMYVSGDGSEMLLFAYDVMPGDLDLDGVDWDADPLRGGMITYSDGTTADRALPAQESDPDHTVDGVAPQPLSVQIETTPMTAGTYGPNETVTVVVRFDEAVDNSSDLMLELDFDGDPRRAEFAGFEIVALSGGRLGHDVSFDYRVQPGDADTDGFAVPRQDLVVRDDAGNEDMRAIGPLRTQQKVDVVSPQVLRTNVVSSAGADRVYEVGDPIDIEVTFTEPVEEAIGFDILVGSVPRTADYDSGDGTAVLRFRYEVMAGDRDDDGIGYGARALLGPIADRVRNLLEGGVQPAADQPAHRVDGGDDNDPPRVTDVRLASQPDRRGTYKVGDWIEVLVAFNEGVEVADGEEPVLALSIGSRTVSAEYLRAPSLAATDTLLFRYPVSHGDLDENGVSVGPIAEALVGGLIHDPSDNVAVREFAALPDQTGHRVDGELPEVTSRTIVSGPGADGFYAFGDDVEVRVEFSEPAVAAHDPDLVLQLDLGGTMRPARLAAGDGTASWLFRYRVQQDDYAPDGIAVGPGALDGGSAEDLPGNPADPIQPALELDSDPAQRVDARATLPAAVAIVSDPGTDRTYAVGDVIEVEVAFQEEVRVSGAPQLILSIGSAQEPQQRRPAALVRERPRPTLLAFRYTVRQGDLDEDGIGVAADALVGGRIVDLLGHEARALVPLAADGEHLVDGIVAEVAGIEIVSTPGSGGVYGLGQPIEFAVAFSDVVHVTDVLTLVMQIGEHTRHAALVDGSGTRSLLFRYVVQDDDRDDDGISVRSHALSCAGDAFDCISDNAGNPVPEPAAGLPAQRGHRVDGRRDQPTLTAASSPARTGGYARGERIDLTLTFRGPVHVQGTPALALSIGGTTVDAAFDGGSGTETLRFAYTVRAGDYDDDGFSVGPGPGALAGGSIVDGSGRLVARNFAPLAAGSGQRVDGEGPAAVRAEIVNEPDEGGTYGLGEIVDIDVEFNEAVHVGQADRLALLLAVGAQTRRADYVDGSGRDKLAFAYRIVAGDSDEDGISIGPDALVGGEIEDLVGNALGDAERRIPPLPPSRAYRVDSGVDRVAPTVTGVEIALGPEDGEYYRAGETIEVKVAFDETVHVEGGPTLGLSVGAAFRHAELAEGSGTGVLLFRYVVQRGDFDLDGVSIGALQNALQGGRIRDAAGNDADRTFPGLPADERQKVNARQEIPAAILVEVVLGPDDGKYYRAGETIEVKVAFNVEVHVAGAPALTLSVGSHDRAAGYAKGSGTDTLRFRYVVAAGDLDKDGISIGPLATALVGGTIGDAAGTEARREWPAVPAQSRHVVDAVPARALEVEITSNPGRDGVYGWRETIKVEVKFDEEVLASGRLSVALSVGAETRSAAFVDGSGKDTLRFGYEVRAGDFDDDGVVVLADSLVGGNVTDRAGNPAILDFDGTVAEGHWVDAVVPAVTDVRIAPKDGTYVAGDAIDVEVEFREEVHVTGDPVLTISVGANSRPAAFATGSGTNVLLFRYVVQDDDYDEDGISIGANALRGGAIEDASGNPAERSFAALAEDPLHRVDAVVPAVTDVRIAPKDGTYVAGDAIDVEVEFREEVHVTGDPVLTISVGANSRPAAFATGSGTNVLLFRYVVQDDDYDEDGISIGANALRGGAIEDASGNPAERSFAALAEDPLHRVDAVVPAVTDVRIAPKDGTYVAGDAIDVEVEFREEVHVTGDPVLTISVGANSRPAAFATGSGTNVLLFRYVVQDDDYDEDGISIGANALRGGAIEDASGNPAERSFAALAEDPLHRVDAVVPAVTDVRIASEDGTYVAGDAIDVEVEFREEVHVTGDPVLTISVGANSRPAAFATGSGTKVLLFRYVVQDDDFDDDGISIGANALQGGAIEDASGNPAERSFAALAADPSHRVGAAVSLLLEPRRIEVGASETLDLAVILAGAGFRYDVDFDAASDDSGVVAAETVGPKLTIRGVGEGVATVAVVARRAHITLLLPVTVEASAAEREVLRHALGAVARGLLSSATDTVGARLRTGATPSAPWARLRPHPRSPYGTAVAGVPAHGIPAGQPDFGVPHAPVHRPGFGGPQRLSFAMPLSGLGNRAGSWGVWGAADVQTFAGEPEMGDYDGRLNTVQIGADIRGDGWVAGASVSRSLADADYRFEGIAEGDAEGTGTLETEITAVYPYVGWSLDDRAEFWTIVGLGTGEAASRREGGPATDEEGTGLSMRLGLAGTRVVLGQAQGFALALRGDAGFVQLVTDDGLRAVEGLEVNAQRVRAGVEASWPTPVRSGVFTPFVDLGGRWDAGDGATGGGLEVAGGFRYRAPTVGVEVKARTLALHGADGYRESGLAATAFLEPAGSGRGLRLSLTPRWGTPDWTGRLWRSDAGSAGPRGDEPAWTVDGRAGYGLGLRGGPGAATPFAEWGLSRDGRDRTRVGVAYERGAAKDQRTSSFEMSIERAEHGRGIMDTRLFVVVEGRFR